MNMSFLLFSLSIPFPSHALSDFISHAPKSLKDSYSGTLSDSLPNSVEGSAGGAGSRRKD